MKLQTIIHKLEKAPFKFPQDKLVFRSGNWLSMLFWLQNANYSNLDEPTKAEYMSEALLNLEKLSKGCSQDLLYYFSRLQLLSFLQKASAKPSINQKWQQLNLFGGES